ncbi:hypothetical protein PHOSAC3_120838 [Mesotoga infera]|nr:hypothetical protein PHOSAC3_120838 [Mesotoga infera]
MIDFGNKVLAELRGAESFMLDETKSIGYDKALKSRKPSICLGLKRSKNLPLFVVLKLQCFLDKHG